MTKAEISLEIDGACKQLELARRLLAGVEDRLFILDDYEIFKHRKTGRWNVACRSVKLEADFDHPLDAAIAITQAKEAAKLLKPEKSLLEIDNEPSQGEVAALLRKCAGVPRAVPNEEIAKWKSDPFAMPTHCAQLEEPPAGTPPLAEDQPLSFRGVPLIHKPYLGDPPSH